MLGGPLALVLVTLSLAAPCAGPLCTVDTVPEIPPPTLDDPSADLDPDPSPLDPPVDATEAVASLRTQLDPLFEAALPTLTPLEGTDRLPLPAAWPSSSLDPTPTRTPAPAADPVDAHHAPPDARTGPTVEAIPEQDPHSATPQRAQVQGAPIDERAPSRAAAALALGLATIGLYHRLTKDRVLEHPTRRRLLELLATTPGLTTSQLAEALEVGYRTARHHADMLATFDLLVADDRHGATRWSLPRDAGDLPAPISEAERELLSLLAEAGGLHLSEIARRLDAAKATVKHRLDKLTSRGWARDERVGPLRRFFPTDDGLERLGAEDG